MKTLSDYAKMQLSPVARDDFFDTLCKPIIKGALRTYAFNQDPKVREYAHVFLLGKAGFPFCLHSIGVQPAQITSTLSKIAGIRHNTSLNDDERITALNKVISNFKLKLNRS